jgi:hypothetical protein
MYKYFKNLHYGGDSNPWSSALESGVLITMPLRQGVREQSLVLRTGLNSNTTSFFLIPAYYSYETKKMRTWP